MLALLLSACDEEEIPTETPAQPEVVEPYTEEPAENENNATEASAPYEEMEAGSFVTGDFPWHSDIS